jgi:hypothetical protein
MMNPTSQTSSTPQAQQQHNSHQQHKWESLHNCTLRKKKLEEDLIISSSSESPKNKEQQICLQRLHFKMLPPQNGKCGRTPLPSERNGFGAARVKQHTPDQTSAPTWMDGALIGFSFLSLCHPRLTFFLCPFPAHDQP